MNINPTYFAIYCHINEIWAHLSHVIIVIGLNNNQDIVHFLNSSSCSWWPFRVYMLLLHSTMMRWPRAIEFYFHSTYVCVCFSWNIQSDLIQGSLSFRENEICFHNHSPFRRYSYLPSGKFCIRENNILRCESI